MEIHSGTFDEIWEAAYGKRGAEEEPDQRKRAAETVGRAIRISVLRQVAALFDPTTQQLSAKRFALEFPEVIQ